jgi:hypothetical protein
VEAARGHIEAQLADGDAHAVGAQIAVCHPHAHTFAYQPGAASLAAGKHACGADRTQDRGCGYRR